ncbi:prenyltransferase [Idiomarina seosinensis]|uniref:1,4-dihydroxy-2-naphthoate prenyltransferase n=1 Tax=Idiomarina seosinensis TaxID=281739 RepID=A0A432Z6X2_9GAMM|nr:prenyltransferase [Idiomarina seosinensis]RUO73654.1 1,4-dihydroxy-2-naphthoate prenyltransferase [Idiomarina seosinensis]
MPPIIGVFRPKFLTLPLVCIFAGYAVSLGHFTQASWLDLMLVIILGLTAHISVNAFNEYFDFKSGLDFTTKRTPFSGGSGTLVNAPHLANTAKTLAVAALVVTSVSGLLLVWRHGWQLLTLGLIGVAVIYTYTQYLNRSPWLCLIAPGIGFGLCMTLGAAWVLSGHLHPGAWIMATLMTLLVVNLLLLNQFPDVNADRAIGRRHFPIVFGLRTSARLFALLHTIAFLLVPVAVAGGYLSVGALLGLFAVFLLGPLLCGVLKRPEAVAHNTALLGLNVAFIHLLPLLTGLGVLFFRDASYVIMS